MPVQNNWMKLFDLLNFCKKFNNSVMFSLRFYVEMFLPRR